MFWLVFIGAIAVLGLLTLLGASLTRRSPGTDWEKQEDRPIIGHGD